MCLCIADNCKLRKLHNCKSLISVAPQTSQIYVTQLCQNGIKLNLLLTWWYIFILFEVCAVIIFYQMFSISVISLRFLLFLIFQFEKEKDEYLIFDTEIKLLQLCNQYIVYSWKWNGLFFTSNFYGSWSLYGV